MEYIYNDGLKPGGRRPSLWLVDSQGAAHKFQGKTLPGVCLVAGSKFTKQGKWSNTDYTLLLSSGVLTLYMLSPLHGTFLDGTLVWEDGAAKMGVPVSALKVAVQATYPEAFARLEEVAAFMASQG